MTTPGLAPTTPNNSPPRGQPSPRGSKEDAARELKRLCKKYHIFFKQQCPKTEWPEWCRDYFDKIQTLGRFHYDTYLNTDVRPKDEPWRNATKQRATKLTKLAEDCKEQSCNEAGWRMRLEHIVFERFNIEVACSKCSGRLWRSEIEVSDNSTSQSARALADRQAKREPCRCPQFDRLGDCDDSGISRLFSDRVQEEVCHHDVSATLLPRKQPDRIYGLRKTTNLANALDATYVRGGEHDDGRRCVEDVIKATPFPRSGEPLLFPFLVVEAKSQKASDTFEDIELQTAFPLRTLLIMQQELQDKVKDEIDVSGGPLVWFFAYKGEDWRLYAGYIKGDIEPRVYHVAELWSGRITCADAALQLILVVDFIMDWARDTYRPSILRQLQVLATKDPKDLMFLPPDSDIFSLRGIESWVTCDSRETIPADGLMASENDDSEPTTTSRLRRFDSEKGYVRHAADLESRLCGLYITGDNANTMLQSFDTDGGRQQFAGSILAALRKGAHVFENDDVVNILENVWTGTNRSSHTAFRKVSVLLRISYFFNIQWDMIRELSFLAVTEDGLDVLSKLAGRPRLASLAHKYSYSAKGKSLLSLMNTELPNSVQGILTAAISRYTFVLSVENTSMVDFEDVRLRMTRRSVHSLIPEENGCSFRELVLHMHEKYRIGQREFEETFIRRSNRHGLDDVIDRDLPRVSATQPLDVSNNMIVVFGDSNAVVSRRDKSFPSLCIYVVKSAESDIQCKTLLPALQEFWARSRFYFTVREGRFSRSSGRRLPKNMKDIYLTSEEISSKLRESGKDPAEMVMEWIAEMLQGPEAQHWFEGHRLYESYNLLPGEMSRNILGPTPL